MIPVVHRMKNVSASRVKKLIHYVTDDQGKGNRVGDIFIANCGAVDPFSIAMEMDAQQQLNTTSKDDKTYHLSVSFPAGEKPTVEQMKLIEERIAQTLGYQEHQRLSVVHGDTDNLHLHMVINKIHPETGNIRTVFRDHAVVAKECARLEKELGLRLDNHEAKKSHREAEIESLEHKSGMEAFASYAREHATTALAIIAEAGEAARADEAEPVSLWRDFHAVLAESGITVSLRGNGLVFADHTGEFSVKGSTVGRQFSKTSLEKSLGAFEPSVEATGKVEEAVRRYEKTGKFAEDLYKEYKDQRETAAAERKERLDGLNRNRQKALESAKDKARKRVRDEGFLANIFRTKRLKEILVRIEERKIVDEIREDFAARRAEVYEEKSKDYRTWLKGLAEGGDSRAAQLLEPRREREAKPGKASGQAKTDAEGRFAEQHPDQRDIGATEANKRRYKKIGDNASCSIEQASEQGKSSITVKAATVSDEKSESGTDRSGYAEKEPPKNADEDSPGKSLREEYAELRSREAEARRQEREKRLAELNKEQETAIVNARIAARNKAEAMPGAFFRTRRLNGILERNEINDAVSRVRQEYRERQRAVWKEGRGQSASYADWLKQKAETGDTRAIFALRGQLKRNPEELSVAPKVVCISAASMKYAKTVASRIHGVTGRGTLFYKVGEEVYRDNGANISLRDNPTEEAVKNGLLLAHNKYAAPLIISGTEDFKAQCLEVARKERLNIKFNDPMLEAARTEGRIAERKIIAVGFDDREEARAHGIAWDREINKWVAPEGTDIKDVQHMEELAKRRAAEEKAARQQRMHGRRNREAARIEERTEERQQAIQEKRDREAERAEGRKRQKQDEVQAKRDEQQKRKVGRLGR